jgi:ribonuclease Z
MRLLDGASGSRNRGMMTRQISLDAILGLSCFLFLSTPVLGWSPSSGRSFLNPRRSRKVHVAAAAAPESVSLASLSPPLEAEQALASLAATTLALLGGDEAEAQSLMGSASQKRETIHRLFQSYDVCQSGTLSVDEARSLFVDLARSIVTEIASGQTREVARAHASRVLADDEAGNTISRVADKLLLLADLDGDGKINLPELAALFDVVHKSSTQPTLQVDTFPQPLRALAGSLQLLPPTQGLEAEEAAERSAQWNVGVPGDDHTLRRVELGKGLSVVGLGRSADASAYFLPELGMVLDAGIHVKSLKPKTVLLTHGHRDHIAALPTHAQGGAKIFVPQPIAPLVRRFLLAEAQLNFGDPKQTDEETIAALGDYDVEGVSDQMQILLPKYCYTGSPTPLGIQVFEAPHKDGVPAVSYGIYRTKSRLKPEYQSIPKNELGTLLRENVQITESYEEGVLLYTGDTTIALLRERWKDILPKYRHIIHEVTFLGPPSSALDKSSKLKGHTHYAQLHPWICAFPETTFICVHWSLRYSREDILAFFKEQYGGVPKNVVLWC